MKIKLCLIKRVFNSSLVVLNTLLIVMLPTVSHGQLKLNSKKINWGTSASDLGLSGRLDQDFKFVCPHNGSVGYVYGTDTYSIGSSICSAGAHSGLITLKDGGKVTIKIVQSPGTYVRTNQNGISSDGGVSDSNGFIFLNSNGSPVANLDERKISWTTSAGELQLSGRLDQDFKFVCPHNGSVGYVYGTDTYSIGSSICSAGVHAGLITLKDGGKVTIKIVQSPGTYVRTNQNGISSDGGVSYSNGFIFLGTSK